ncbi:DUF2567 domain-containing protein, partial [Prescottella equi]|uniref:DUF2567 domain-containing protein n=1 Tax=Rhodococcus hoagii TaxID=43767 RepID=UPI0009BD6FB9
MSALLGVPAGLIWALLAPAVHMLVVAEDRGVVLTTENLHRFDALAIFVGTTIVVGVLSAVVVWGMRRSRGPGAMAALVCGSVAGSGVAALVGVGGARLRYPEVTAPAVGSGVPAAPRAAPPLGLLVPPRAAAPGELLGRGPPPPPPPP